VYVITSYLFSTRREPFQLPANPAWRRAAVEAKRKLSAGTFSDHMALLRAFQVILCSFSSKNFLIINFFVVVAGVTLKEQRSALL